MGSVHHFPSTVEAYEQCQCDAAMKDGDILVIHSEQVVGIAHTWPVAVTVKHGALHVFDPAYTDGDQAILMGLDVAFITSAREFAKTAFPVSASVAS